MNSVGFVMTVIDWDEESGFVLTTVMDWSGQSRLSREKDVKIS